MSTDQIAEDKPAIRPCSLAERKVCALWLQEHGDYRTWSAETHTMYEKTMRILAEVTS